VSAVLNVLMMFDQNMLFRPAVLHYYLPLCPCTAHAGPVCNVSQSAWSENTIFFVFFFTEKWWMGIFKKTQSVESLL